jgi:hypothetical protein
LTGAALLAALAFAAWQRAAPPSHPTLVATPPAAAPASAVPATTRANGEASPASPAEPAATARAGDLECGSGPCDQSEPVEPGPEDTAAAIASRPLPADLDTWALDPSVDPAWRARKGARPRTLGNLPPAPDEYDATPAEEVQEAGYIQPNGGR